MEVLKGQVSIFDLEHKEENKGIEKVETNHVVGISNMIGNVVMSKEKLLEYCYENEEKFILNHESVKEGQEQFDCLIVLVEDGDIENFEQLKEYGMGEEVE